jgi:hypothetical protein
MGLAMIMMMMHNSSKCRILEKFFFFLLNDKSEKGYLGSVSVPVFCLFLT